MSRSPTLGKSCRLWRQSCPREVEEEREAAVAEVRQVDAAAQQALAASLAEAAKRERERELEARRQARQRGKQERAAERRRRARPRKPTTAEEARSVAAQPAPYFPVLEATL